MIDKTLRGAIFGAISGISTLFLVSLIYVVLEARFLFEAFLLMIGNFILYGLVVFIGGAIAGFLLGVTGAWLGKQIKVRHGEKLGGILGGIIGGVVVGVSPIWIGLGHL